ncbi:serine/threonine protein kinase [Methanosarcina sp. KYL-1]|uniref:serine/threonine-protein kinase n=1 Tax=Methanosarcina sp. KYL-1 TaxID=2602068 RepID=UPI002100D8AC|nr:serine/threonine-protein kinase [Methanosarcina sp. KYL-1]MCQ1535871.1 serine/threonine protein kinase [Methanosarcina sp. KYL-1]
MNGSNQGIIIGNKYLVDKLIETGGCGTVYQVTDCLTGNILALKMCNENDEESKRRFAREVRLMERLDHENVMSILDYNLEEEPQYFVMPLAKCSLEDKIDKLKENPQIALRYFREACKGIKAIHDAGEVHRDIKPHNFLISEDERVLVTDLGIGKFEQRDTMTLTTTHQTMGTLEYLPPESFNSSREMDNRSDIYQLGKTLYNILTGTSPATIDEKLIPTGFGYIILKATRNNPNDRFQSVDDLLEALDNVSSLIDPKKNPSGSFESLLSEINRNFEEGIYEEQKVEELLHLMFMFENDSKLFLDFFDMIPLKLLKKMVINETINFEKIIEVYSEIICNLGYYDIPFEYAETIARRMKIVYLNTKKVDLKVSALKSILISSVSLNRFAAMDTFIELLLDVRDIDEIIAVNGLLIKEKVHFKMVAKDIKREDLNPAFRAIWDSVVNNS